MNKFLALGLVLSGISFGALAQDGVTKRNDDKKSYVRKEYVHTKKVKLSPQDVAEKRTAKLEKELNLTSKQRNEVYNLSLDQAKKFEKKQEIRKDEREIERKERFAQREKFVKLLTPEQKATWKEKFAKRSKSELDSDKEGRKEFHKRVGKRKMDRRVG